ncbi:MAG: LysM peptidoglycan-binding domain-containing protein [Bacteroidales bacterium]|nr:LysM peptidoglycan-binding domain-containing protein [Bacteroidales bacterium]
MKRFVIVSALCLMLAASPAAMAQKFTPAPVEISATTVTVGDNVYYEHTVQGRQTLYSICKAYGASLDEVSAANSDKLESGLKAGSVLLIPVGGNATEAVSADAAEVQGNTDTSSGEGSGYVLHRVKWYDSLLMLSLKYKVSKDDIIALNNLTSKTLVVGQVIKIPVEGSGATGADNSMIDDGEDDLFAEDGSDAGITIISDEDAAETVSEDEDVPVFIPFSGTARIALVLPISASSPSPADNFLDLYSGVLMALNYIKASGINVNLKVVDSEEYGSFDEMAALTGLENYDFIIGHFPLEVIDVAADFCDRNRIPLISPVDPKMERVTYRHPYMINIPVSASTQALRLAESIGFDSVEDNVIVLCENGEDLGQFHNDIISSLDYLGIPYSVAHSGIGRQGSAHVAEHLDASRQNHIIITSERESLASDAVRNTGLLGREDRYKVTGYASQKVRRFDSIDPESFQNMNAHFCLGYYVDYKDERVREFVRSYRALFNAEPGPYAFQGYDIVVYAVKALEKYGSDMINGICFYPASGLQLNFRFDRRTPGGGVFNEATRNLIYNDVEASLCN